MGMGERDVVCLFPFSPAAAAALIVVRDMGCTCPFCCCGCWQLAAAMLPVSLCQRVCHLGVKTQLRWLSLSLRVSLGLNMSLSLSLRSRLRDVVNWGPGTCGVHGAITLAFGF